MGKAEILEVLKKRGEWMTANEICEDLDENTVSIRNCLRRMRNHNEVEYRKVKKRLSKVTQYKTKI